MHPKGFQKAPKWMDVKKLLNPCTCPGVKENEACKEHPFKDHKYKHYLFNLPNPDPKKRIMVHMSKKGLVEDTYHCSKDMKVATIHKLCSSIGSTIESLKEKKRQQDGKCSRDEIFRVQDFTCTDQTQQNRCHTVYIDCNGGKPSITWNATDGFSFNTSHNPIPIPAKSKRDYRKLYGMYQRQNTDFPLKIPQRKGVVGCPFSVSLKYDRYHGYFLCIPYWKKKKEFAPITSVERSIDPVTRRTIVTSRTRRQRLLALATDPGVRTFQTSYDTAGQSTKYGHKNMGRIMRLALKMDKLESRLDHDLSASREQMNDDHTNMDIENDLSLLPSDNVPSSTTYKRLRKKNRRALKRQRNTLAAKIDNLKADVHWKIANEWCTRAEHVLIPIFKVSQMINCFKRKIRKQTVREMLHWSHYAFRQKLKCKGEEYSTHIHEVGEEYTTKGCGECGRIDENIGGKKIFKCKYCTYIADRDRGSARTIILKNIEAFVGTYDFSMLQQRNLAA